MADLATIAKIPHVSSAVLGDLTGGFFDAIREPDGESVAAVAGFLSANFAQAGERLGLGTLGRITSYNVCYTKLLRTPISPFRHPRFPIQPPCRPAHKARRLDTVKATEP